MDKLNIHMFHRKFQLFNNLNTGNCNIEKLCTKLVNNHKTFLKQNTFKETFYPLQQKGGLSQHLQ